MIAGKQPPSSSCSKSTTTISSSEMRQVIQQMQMNRHRPSTKRNYFGIWKVFNNFIVKLDAKPKQWGQCLTLFVAYLIKIAL